MLFAPLAASAALGVGKAIVGDIAKTVQGTAASAASASTPAVGGGRFDGIGHEGFEEDPYSDDDDDYRYEDERTMEAVSLRRFSHASNSKTRTHA